MTKVLYLLDTSALLAHYRQEVGWEEVQSLFDDREAEIVVAGVSLAEFGRRLAELGADDSETTRVLDQYESLMTEVVAIDSAIARGAFLISRQTTERLPLIDALIAAAAQAHGAILVHRDNHMTAIPEELLQKRHLGTKTDAREHMD